MIFYLGPRIKQLCKKLKWAWSNGDSQFGWMDVGHTHLNQTKRET